MKRVKDLYDEIIDLSTLRVASRCASKGKRKRVNVKRFMGDIEQKLALLHDLLFREKYKPMKYSSKIINDKCTGKIREIFIPKFYPDQIVQWALMLVIKPILMRGMYDYCCASVDNRGASYGIKTVQKWLKNDPRNTKYCLICDVRKFYPSIDQDLLLKKFETIIKDQKTLNLIKIIVRSVPSGVPIGNYTSQWFANFYLQDFDHYVKEQLKIPHYIRYMDDMVFFSPNKRKLGKWQKEIEKYLNNEHLTIKPNWQVFKIADKKGSGRPLDFLGYKFYRNYITMRSKTFLRAVRRIRKIYKKDYLTARDSSAIMSYSARIKVTSGNRFYLKYLQPYVNVGQCRFTISRHDKLRNKAEKEALRIALQQVE